MLLEEAADGRVKAGIDDDRVGGGFFASYSPASAAYGVSHKTHYAAVRIKDTGRDRRMDIRDYEYIVAIAEHGSISRAAEQLFITQSALNKFLQRMEQNLGLSLFCRQGGQLMLTSIGQQYVEIGRQIIRLDRKLEEEMDLERARQKGQIRLGYSMGRSSFILEEILPAFYRKYPDVQVYTRAEAGRDQMNDLQHNVLDLALYSDLERLPGLEYRAVDTDRLVLAVPWDSPLAEQAVPSDESPYPVIGQDCLENLPLITLRTSTKSGNLARNVLEQYQIHPRMVLEVSDVRSLLDAVERGLGAALFLSVPQGSRRLHYLSIAGLEVPEQVTYLVFRAERKMPPPMRYLAELILGKPVYPESSF